MVQNDSLGILSLINGKSYQIFPTRSDHPFLNYKSWEKGRILTIREEFQDVSINYDLNQDALVLSLPVKNRNELIVLNPDQIKAFYLNNRTFINPSNYFSNCGGTERAYFELLFESKLCLLIRWNKFIPQEEKVTQSRFEVSREVFFRIDDTLYPINSRKSIIRLFPGQKKEISAFMRADVLKINKMKEKDLVRLAELCNSFLD